MDIAKISGRGYDRKSPKDMETIMALRRQLDDEETEGDIRDLQKTIDKVEETLRIMRERDFSGLSEEELQEVNDVVSELDRFKADMNALVDQYLGQGALAELDLPDDVYADIKRKFGQPSEFFGWGAREPGDPELMISGPTIPLAEASLEDPFRKQAQNPNKLNELVKIANELDSRKLTKEADQVDAMIEKYSDALAKKIIYKETK